MRGRARRGAVPTNRGESGLRVLLSRRQARERGARGPHLYQLARERLMIYRAWCNEERITQPHGEMLAAMKDDPSRIIFPSTDRGSAEQRRLPNLGIGAVYMAWHSRRARFLAMFLAKPRKSSQPESPPRCLLEPLRYNIVPARFALRAFVISQP